MIVRTTLNLLVLWSLGFSSLVRAESACDKLLNQLPLRLQIEVRSQSILTRLKNKDFDTFEKQSVKHADALLQEVLAEHKASNPSANDDAQILTTILRNGSRYASLVEYVRSATHYGKISRFLINNPKLPNLSRGPSDPKWNRYINTSESSDGLIHSWQIEKVLFDIHALDWALQKAPQIKKTVLHRGEIWGPHRGIPNVGDVETFHNFISTSRTPKIAHNFSIVKKVLDELVNENRSTDQTQQEIRENIMSEKWGDQPLQVHTVFDFKVQSTKGLWMPSVLNIMKKNPTVSELIPEDEVILPRGGEFVTTFVRYLDTKPYPTVLRVLRPID